MVRKIVPLVLIPLLLALSGYGAQKLALFSWDAVVEYESPYIFSLPSGNAGDPLARRVVLVVIDGLRLDTSRQMPFLNELRQQGADLVVRTGQPSLSYAAWTVIATGAWQETTGVTTNWYKGYVRVDNIFKSAQEAGIRTAAVGSSGWGQLFGPWLDEKGFVKEPEEEAQITAQDLMGLDVEVLRNALSLLGQEDGPRLLLVHFVSTDYLGHRYGGLGELYREGALRIDGHLRRLVEKLNLEEDALIITSDHGHVDTGGHGGWEDVVIRVPLVMVGKGIRAGVYPEAQQVDIAPTVAFLLGIHFPVHSQGQPLMAALDAPAQVKGRRGLDAALQLVGFYDAYAQVMGVRPFAGDVLKTFREDLARGEEGALSRFHETLIRKALAVRNARLWRERVMRFPSALLIALAPGLYLLLYRKRPRELLLPFLGMAFYFALYNVTFFVLRGCNWSLSAFNTESQIKSFFNQRLLDAALFTVVMGLLLALLSHRKEKDEIVLREVTFSFLVSYVLLLQVDFFYWLYNVRFPWYIPDLRLGFKYYLDLLQMVPVGFLALVLPPLALGVRWGIRRLRPEKAVPLPSPERPPEEPPPGEGEVKEE